MANPNNPQNPADYSEEFQDLMGITDLEEEAPKAADLIDKTANRIKNLVSIPESINSADEVQQIIDSLGSPDSFMGTIINTDEAGKKTVKTELVTNREGDIKALRRIKLVLDSIGSNLSQLKAKQRKLSTETIGAEQAGDRKTSELKSKEYKQVSSQIEAYNKANPIIQALLEKYDYRRDFVEINNGIDELAQKALNISVTGSDDIDGLRERFPWSEQDAKILTRVQTRLRDGEADALKKVTRINTKALDLAAKIITKLASTADKDETFYNDIIKNLLVRLERVALGMVGHGENTEAAEETYRKTAQWEKEKIEGANTEAAQAAEKAYREADRSDESNKALEDIFGEDQ